MRLIIIVVLLSFISNNYSQTKNFENLVLEGAGIRGIAYGGALKVLEEKGILQNIKKVGGTSAGAITALLVSLGYSADEISNIISETKFQKFNDGNFIFIGGILRIKNRFGWYRKNAFDKWLGTMIYNKTKNSDITLSELKNEGFKELCVTATCLNKQQLFYISAETFPKMKVKDAVRASMSIPLYFEAVFIDSLGQTYKNKNCAKKLDILIDGGITGNFPISMFDSVQINYGTQKTRIPNMKTLGLRIDTDCQIENDTTGKPLAYYPIENIPDYVQAFYVYALENLNRSSLTKEDWDRTISISSVNIGPKVRRLTPVQKDNLIKSGERNAKLYFNKQFLPDN